MRFTETRESVRTAAFPRSRAGRWRRTKVLRVCWALLAATTAWVVAGSVLQSAGVLPGSEGTVSAVVAVRELPVGAVIGDDDVRLESWPSGRMPASAVRTVGETVGRATSSGIGPGEVVTSYRLRGPDQLAGLPAGRLAVAAAVSDTALLGSIRPGDMVTLLAPGTGQSVADKVVVLAVDPGVGDAAVTTTTDRGGHLVVALTAEQARSLAVASGSATGGGPGLVVALSG